jgi:hypothetical protein
MTSPDHPTKSGPYRSNVPAVGREVLDYEGFFIAWPKPEPSGNRTCPYIYSNIYCCFKVCVIY